MSRQDLKAAQEAVLGRCFKAMRFVGTKLDGRLLACPGDQVKSILSQALTWARLSSAEPKSFVVPFSGASSSSQDATRAASKAVANSGASGARDAKRHANEQRQQRP